MRWPRLPLFPGEEQPGSSWHEPVARPAGAIPDSHPIPFSQSAWPCFSSRSPTVSQLPCEFKEYVAADPAAFIQRAVQRVVPFWFMPSRNQRFKDLFLFPLTALAMLGAWRIARRLPIEWLFWPLGTYGLTTLLPRWWWEYLQIPYPPSMGGSSPRMAPLSSPQPPAQAA